MDLNSPLSLTPEQSAAIDGVSDAIYVVDPATQRRYRLVEDPEQPRLTLEELRGMLQVGIDELDRGEGVLWDAEEVKSEVRRRLEERGLT